MDPLDAIVISLTGIALLLNAALRPDTVSVDYDEEADVTSVRLRWSEGSPFDLAVVSRCEGDAVCVPDSSRLLFTSLRTYRFDPRLRYRGANRVELRIGDAAPVILDGAGWDGKTTEEMALEVVAVAVAFPLLARLARAERASVAIGETLGALDRDQLDDVLDYVRRLEGSRD